jgi:vacuolar protein sorting-associated protein 72
VLLLREPGTYSLIQTPTKSIPKKSKVKVRTLTQDELIARALDMEEGNIIEHKNYLFVEEEKRKRAHAVRVTLSGPLLRWVSRRETVSVPADIQGPPGRLRLASPSGVPGHLL